MARYLAIDWDQNQLHVIAAEVRGGAVQIRRAALTSEGQTPNPSNAAELGKLLAERLEAAGIAKAPVLACLGRDRLIVKEIRYPRVPDAEEPAVVRFQTVKELTDAPEDVVIDYMPVYSPPEGEQKAMALVIRKEVFQTYRTLCKAAGLELAALTPRLVGTAACLRKVMGSNMETPAPDPADGAVCVVVLGEKQAELAVLEGRVPFLTRSFPNASNLAGEIRRNLAVHAGQAPQHPIRAVYLTGKGATELRERLGEMTEIPVHTFDPFAGSDAVDLPTGNRGTFAGAMGLLQAKAAGELAINFVAPRQPRAIANPNYRLVRLAIVAGVSLVIGLAVLGRILYASWSSDLEAVQLDRAEVEKQLAATSANGKNLKTIDDWDAPVWLDEFYELTAIIPDVNLLRITSMTTDPLPRNPKMRAAAKWTIKGKLLGKSNPRKPLDQLVEEFRKEGFYTPDAPKVEDDKFTLVVSVNRRGPTKYTSTIAEEKPKAIKGGTKTDKIDKAKTKRPDGNE